nr:MAG TPA: hypothetical protein [Caudoviricetes sp.]
MWYNIGRGFRKSSFRPRRPRCLARPGAFLSPGSATKKSERFSFCY